MNDLKSWASGALTRRFVAAVCVLVVGLALVGCTRPEPVETPVTPTSTWAKDDQRAIDAVQRYLDVWTEIGENVDTADWNRIYEVAGDPVAEDDIYFWGGWKEKGPASGWRPGHHRDCREPRSSYQSGISEIRVRLL